MHQKSPKLETNCQPQLNKIGHLAIQSKITYFTTIATVHLRIQTLLSPTVKAGLQIDFILQHRQRHQWIRATIQNKMQHKNHDKNSHNKMIKMPQQAAKATYQTIFLLHLQ